MPKLLANRLVLVVDDEHEVCLMVAAMLKNNGAIVMKASGVEEAIVCVNNLDFDLIVTDMNMPLGSGNDLRDSLRIRHVPLILMSGALDAYLAEGFAARLEKPFDEATLMKTINQVLTVI